MAPAAAKTAAKAAAKAAASTVTDAVKSATAAAAATGASSSQTSAATSHAESSSAAPMWIALALGLVLVLAALLYPAWAEHRRRRALRLRAEAAVEAALALAAAAAPVVPSGGALQRGNVSSAPGSARVSKKKKPKKGGGASGGKESAIKESPHKSTRARRIDEAESDLQTDGAEVPDSLAASRQHSDSHTVTGEAEADAEAEAADAGAEGEPDGGDDATATEGDGGGVLTLSESMQRRLAKKAAKKAAKAAALAVSSELAQLHLIQELTPSALTSLGRLYTPQSRIPDPAAANVANNFANASTSPAPAPFAWTSSASLSSSTPTVTSNSASAVLAGTTLSPATQAAPLTVAASASPAAPVPVPTAGVSRKKKSAVPLALAADETLSPIWKMSASPPVPAVAAATTATATATALQASTSSSDVAASAASAPAVAAEKPSSKPAAVPPKAQSAVAPTLPVGRKKGAARSRDHSGRSSPQLPSAVAATAAAPPPAPSSSSVPIPSAVVSASPPSRTVKILTSPTRAAVTDVQPMQPMPMPVVKIAPAVATEKPAAPTSVPPASSTDDATKPAEPAPVAASVVAAPVNAWNRSPSPPATTESALAASASAIAAAAAAASAAAVAAAAIAAQPDSRSPSPPPPSTEPSRHFIPVAVSDDDSQPSSLFSPGSLFGSNAGERSATGDAFPASSPQQRNATGPLVGVIGAAGGSGNHPSSSPSSGGGNGGGSFGSHADPIFSLSHAGAASSDELFGTFSSFLKASLSQFNSSNNLPAGSGQQQDGGDQVLYRPFRSMHSSPQVTSRRTSISQQQSEVPTTQHAAWLDDDSSALGAAEYDEIMAEMRQLGSASATSDDSYGHGNALSAMMLAGLTPPTSSLPHLSGSMHGNQQLLVTTSPATSTSSPLLAAAALSSMSMSAQQRRGSNPSVTPTSVPSHPRPPMHTHTHHPSGSSNSTTPSNHVRRLSGGGTGGMINPTLSVPHQWAYNTNNTSPGSVSSAGSSVQHYLSPYSQSSASALGGGPGSSHHSHGGGSSGGSSSGSSSHSAATVTPASSIHTGAHNSTAPSPIMGMPSLSPNSLLTPFSNHFGSSQAPSPAMQQQQQHQQQMMQSPMQQSPAPSPPVGRGPHQTSPAMPLSMQQAQQRVSGGGSQFPAYQSPVREHLLGAPPNNSSGSATLSPAHAHYHHAHAASQGGGGGSFANSSQHPSPHPHPPMQQSQQQQQQHAPPAVAAGAPPPVSHSHSPYSHAPPPHAPHSSQQQPLMAPGIPPSMLSTLSNLTPAQMAHLQALLSAAHSPPASVTSSALPAGPPPPGAPGSHWTPLSHAQQQSHDHSPSPASMLSGPSSGRSSQAPLLGPSASAPLLPSPGASAAPTPTLGMPLMSASGVPNHIPAMPQALLGAPPVSHAAVLKQQQLQESWKQYVAVAQAFVQHQQQQQARQPPTHGTSPAR